MIVQPGSRTCVLEIPAHAHLSNVDAVRRSLLHAKTTFSGQRGCTSRRIAPGLPDTPCCGACDRHPAADLWRCRCSNDDAGTATSHRYACDLAAQPAIHAARRHSAGVHRDHDARHLADQSHTKPNGLRRIRQCLIIRGIVRRRRVVRHFIDQLRRQHCGDLIDTLDIDGRSRRNSAGLNRDRRRRNQSDRTGARPHLHSRDAFDRRLRQSLRSQGS